MQLISAKQYDEMVRLPTPVEVERAVYTRAMEVLQLGVPGMRVMYPDEYGENARRLFEETGLLYATLLSMDADCHIRYAYNIRAQQLIVDEESLATWRAAKPDDVDAALVHVEDTARRIAGL